jgi:hypothetical protein
MYGDFLELLLADGSDFGCGDCRAVVVFSCSPASSISFSTPNERRREDDFATSTSTLLKPAIVKL